MISAHREAFELYARALRNAPPDLQPAERAALLEAHAREASAIDDNRTAADGFEAARDAWLRADRPLAAAEAVVPLVGALHLLGATSRSARVAWTRALARPAAVARRGAADDGAATARAAGRIEAGLAAAYMLSRQLDEGVAHAEAARALATEATDDATLRNAGSPSRPASRSAATWRRRRAARTADRAARTAGAEAEASRGYRMLGSWHR